VFGLPPSIADTEEAVEGIRFRISEVMHMHSAITRDTGSTATDTGRLRYCIRGGTGVNCEDGADSMLEDDNRPSLFIEKVYRTGAPFAAASKQKRGPEHGYILVEAQRRWRK
jgi:hypothetical protein